MTGFNAAAWNGDKPLVEPMEHRPVAPGDIVAAHTPVDSKGEPVVRGVVADVVVTSDGEQLVTVVVEAQEHGRRHARRVTVNADELDPGWHIQSSPHGRQPAERAAARIAIAVGTRRLNGGTWTDDDLWLLGAAQRLASLDRGQS